MSEIIISFLIAILMGMGIGGGGLFIIYLTLYLNFDQITSQGTNLVFFLISAIASLIIHIRKRKIFPLQVVIMAVFGVIGSLIFSHLANMVDPDIPRKILGGVLIIGGVLTIINTFKKTTINE